VKAGSIFGHFLLTDDFEAAKSKIDEINLIREGEKKLKEEQDQKDREAAAEANKPVEEVKDEEEKEDDKEEL